MTSATGRRAQARRGRKQDPAVSEAILVATRALLLERGYDRFTVQDVAARCGAGVGAIYRRWSSKEALVAEAIRTGGELSHDQTDDAAADLVALVQNRATLATSHPDFVPGVVSAMRESPDVDDAMRQVHTTAAYHEVLSRLLGADHPHLELLAELAPAIIVHRSIFGGELEPDALAAEVLALARAFAQT